MVCSSWGEPLHSQLTPATFPSFLAIFDPLSGSMIFLSKPCERTPSLRVRERTTRSRSSSSPMPRSHSAYRSTSSAFFQIYERIDTPTTVSAAPRSNHPVFFFAQADSKNVTFKRNGLSRATPLVLPYWYLFSRHFISRNAVECLETKFSRIYISRVTSCAKIYTCIIYHLGVTWVC